MLLVLLIGALLLPDSSQTMAQEVCTSPTIGSNIQMRLSNSENADYYGQYYLNTAEPACCNGTLLSLDYCYYGQSQYNNTYRFWGAAVALYHPQSDQNYKRVSESITLSKRAPSDPSSPDPDDDLLLNFNCYRHMLNSFLHVQRGDVFGVLVFADQTFLRLGGLDLVGESSNGYLMLNKSTDGLDLSFSIGSRNLDVDLPLTLDGLSLDTEKRVLHVYANITHPSACITPSRDSGITSSKMSITVLRPGMITVTSTRDPYSTTNSTTVTISIIGNKPMTENKKPNVVESSPPWSIIIGGVLGVMVIIGILISTATVRVIIYKKGQRASFDLTTNEAYTERKMHQVHHIDEGDDSYEAIQDGTTDVSNVPLEQNAAYIVTSSIEASRNVAYENASEFNEYEYIN